MDKAKKRLLIYTLPLLILAALLLIATESPPAEQALASADYSLQDDKSLYDLSRLGRVLTLYLEVGQNAKGHSLASLETPETARSARLPAILREGSAADPFAFDAFGYNAFSTNATLEVLGEPAQNRKYHSFKLRLKDSAGQYEGQSILNLKKGYGKPCRVEEKFACDLFSTLPSMLSLRTRFVHLYIKDLSSATPAYDNYGLYTLVEQPDENYFLNRSLDTAGSLYKAEAFDFSLAAALLEVSDPAYDKVAFEQILDIKQGDSHEGLLAMLGAVNDPALDIDAVVEAYFDKENLLTWLAMNGILGNGDCVTQGYLLYKPLLSQKWYFIPGNMSGAMPAGGDDNVAAVMQSGLSMFYGNLLYERFLSKEANARALEAKIDELMRRFTPGYIAGITRQYRPVLQAFLFVNPDQGTLKRGGAHILQRVAQYHACLEANVRAFKQNRAAPRKVELLEPLRQEGGFLLSWTPSRQLGGGTLAYTLEVAADPGFTAMLHTQELAGTQALVTGLPAGWFYYRVWATDEKGGRAGCVNISKSADDSLLYGAAAAYNLSCAYS